MTLRDIAVAFGIEVDQSSVSAAENAIKGVKSFASKVLGAIGIGFSIAGITNLAETSAEVDALNSQFSQVFGDMEQDASKKLDKIAGDTGVTVNRMKSSFTQIAAFAKTTGMEQTDALNIADRSMKAVADSAAFYDRSIENVTESLQSFLKGNYENDAALGLSCTETTRNAAANALYKKSFNDLSESEKQLTLLKMVEDANKASGALGQAARESDTWTNQIGNLKQSLVDLKAQVGGVFLQPALKVVKITNALVQKVTKELKNLTKEGGKLYKVFDRLHALVKVFKPAVDRMMQTITNGLHKGIDTVKSFVNKIGGVDNALKVLAIVAGAFFIAMNWGKIIDGAKAFLKLLIKMKGLFSIANLKILAVIAVVVILALIVEDFVNFLLGNDSLLGTIFDKMGIGADNARKAVFNAFVKLKNFLISTWDFLKRAAFMWIEAVKSFFKRHSDSIRENFERTWGIIKTFLNGAWIFLQQLSEIIFGKTEDNINGKTKSTKEKLLSIWGKIIDTLTSIWDSLYEVANAVFNAIASVIETVFGWIEIFWNAWGSRVLSWFSVLWNSACGILNGFLDFIKAVADFITSVFTGDWQGAWEAIKQIFVGVWDVILNFIKAVWDTIKLLFELDSATVKTIWDTIWKSIFHIVCNILKKIKDYIKGIFLKIIAGIKSDVDNIKKTIIDGLTKAIDWIKGLKNQAFDWGKDLIDGLAKGIKSRINKVVDGVKGVGNKIKKYLHFSRPDEGPLRDYETWMPDMMKGLAVSIDKSDGILIGKIRNIADEMSILMQGATASVNTASVSNISNRTSNMTQNVTISNTYSGESTDAQKNVSRAMKKSAVDTTTQLARALAYSRG